MRALIRAALAGREDPRDVLMRVAEEVEQLRATERGPADKIGFRDYIVEHFRQTLRDSGITSGTIGELGGPGNSFRDRMPEYRFEFLSIYPDPDDPAVKVADITHCPQIADERYDVVLSVSVMEHVARPWAAAREIRRILKPGGVVYHAAPFSYFFHGAPMDFWRYTPSAFEQLFEDFEQLHGSFYGANRRRNNVGSPTNPVDGDGGPAFAVDAFGGWRENWFTLYAARKSEEAAAALHERREAQLAVDVTALLTSRGIAEPALFEQASQLMRYVIIGAEGDLRRGWRPSGMPPEQARSVWRRKRQLGLQPSANVAVLDALLPADSTFA